MNERLKELAVQAGLESVSDNLFYAYNENLERFAELVRQDEREAINIDHRIAQAAGAKKGKKGYWEFDEHELKVFIELSRESEREACAALCGVQMSLIPTQSWNLNPYLQCIEAIRARGEK